MTANDAPRVPLTDGVGAMDMATAVDRGDVAR